jgi:hypothetical protein
VEKNRDLPDEHDFIKDSPHSQTTGQPMAMDLWKEFRGGNTREITTKFCHPIKVNHIDKINGKEPCHFCDEPAYPILGLETKEVEVIDWKDGRGLEEVSGGHRGEDVENTRVCASCTLKRLPIILCPVS